MSLQDLGRKKGKKKEKKTKKGNKKSKKRIKTRHGKKWVGVDRASERKFSRGYEGQYQAPKSYWAPKPYRAPCC